MTILRVEGADVYYGNIHALKDVSLLVERGEIVTLIGSNGAGKTTTLRAISGLAHPRRGTIALEGKDITRTPAHRIATLGIAHVPEGRRVFGRLTVRENLEMGAYTRHDRDWIAADLDEVFAVFPRLKERIRQTAGTLSGGEQQMLAMGRALMARPQLLLLDEPSMGLAPLLVEQIFRSVTDINRAGTTVLLVEQNAYMALQVATRGYVLQTGSVVLSGPAESLLANEEVRKAYLGE
ncbi:MAG: ABC transporter ATP-binding protein [Armatimonadetes bacterium]|nr:ABC transporter ATP-binding protein [Armatimonadota bacterium]